MDGCIRSPQCRPTFWPMTLLPQRLVVPLQPPYLPLILCVYVSVWYVKLPLASRKSSLARSPSPVSKVDSQTDRSPTSRLPEWARLTPDIDYRWVGARARGSSDR